MSPTDIAFDVADFDENLIHMVFRHVDKDCPDLPVRKLTKFFIHGRMSFDDLIAKLQGALMLFDCREASVHLSDLRLDGACETDLQQLGDLMKKFQLRSIGAFNIRNVANVATIAAALHYCGIPQLGVEVGADMRFVEIPKDVLSADISAIAMFIVDAFLKTP